MEPGDTHSQDGTQIRPNLRSSEFEAEQESSRLNSISSQEFPREQLIEQRDFKMAEMQEYYNKKNMKELQRENFYDKLMALKAEQEEHIKLVESVYFKELRSNQNVSKLELTRRPKSILKHKISSDKVTLKNEFQHKLALLSPNPLFKSQAHRVAFISRISSHLSATHLTLEVRIKV